MGLDTTHGCWHGAYSAFMRWREKLAEVAGLPPLMLMEGFYLADRLAELLPKLPEGDGGGHIGHWREKTQTFIDGLRLAASRGEDVEFH